VFEEEQYSAILAHEAKHIVLVHADPEHRLFPVMYKWLALESSVCKFISVTKKIII